MRKIGLTFLLAALAAFLIAPFCHAQGIPYSWPSTSTGGGGGSGTTVPGGSTTGALQYRTAGGTFGGDNSAITDGSGGLSLTKVSSTNISATSILSNVISSTTYLGMSLPQLFDSRTNTASSTLVLGSGSGVALTAGTGNVLLGIGAGSRITNGGLNLGIGLASLDSLVSGNNNAALGYRSLRFATGSNNTGLGIQSCQSVTIGSSNLCLGMSADVFAPAGSSQLSIANAIYGNIGSGSGNANLIGINVTSPTASLEVSGTVSATNLSTPNFVITSATILAGQNLYARTDGSKLFMDGSGGMQYDYITDRTMFSETDLPPSTTPSATVHISGTAIIASKAVINGTTFSSSTLDVYGAISTTNSIQVAGASLFVSGSNTGLGAASFGTLTSGNANIGIGGTNYLTLTGSSNNVAVGVQALRITTGANNLGLGTFAGNLLTTGSNNITIGGAAQVFSNTGSSQLSIANAIYGNIGSGAGNANLIGVNLTSPTANLDVSGTIKLTGAGVPCTSSLIGAERDVVTTNSKARCNGTNWVAYATTTIVVSASTP